MSYEVGTGELIDGLDEAVRGLSAGRVDDLHTALVAGEYAGEDADVTVTVTSVKERELPELDDEFAQMASEFDTLDELRDDLRSRLDRIKKLEQGAQARDKVLEHLLEIIEVPVPENLVERRDRVARARRRCTPWPRRGRVRRFPRREGKTREEFDAEQRKRREEAVKTQFILDAIADARRSPSTTTSCTEQIMAQAQRNRMSPEQFAQQLQQAGQLGAIVADVRRTKALAQLLEQATVTDASGNVVDLEALRHRGDRRGRRRRGRGRLDERHRRGRSPSVRSRRSSEPSTTTDEAPTRPATTSSDVRGRRRRREPAEAPATRATASDRGGRASGRRPGDCRRRRPVTPSANSGPRARSDAAVTVG